MMSSTTTKSIENQNNGKITKTNETIEYKLRTRKYIVLCNSWMVWNRPCSSVLVSREISQHYMESVSNKLETNLQLKNILSLAGAPRKYKNFIRASLNKLYLWSSNCRDLFTNDDWSMGNKEGKIKWQRRKNTAFKEESQGSNHCLSPTQFTGASPSKLFISILFRCGKGNWKCNSN